MTCSHVVRTNSGTCRRCKCPVAVAVHRTAHRTKPAWFCTRHGKRALRAKAVAERVMAWVQGEAR